MKGVKYSDYSRTKFPASFPSAIAPHDEFGVRLFVLLSEGFYDEGSKTRRCYEQTLIAHTLLDS